MPLVIKLKRIVCHTQTTKVSYVFTKRKRTVQRQIFKRIISIKLIDKLSCKIFEAFPVFFCPPFIQVSFFVKTTALVIKSMRDLMSDHSTDATIINSSISLPVKKWWL